MKVTVIIVKLNITRPLTAILKESKLTVGMKTLMPYCSQTEQQSITVWVRIYSFVWSSLNSNLPRKY